MGDQLPRCELRTCHEIQQRPEATGCRSTDEVQSRHGAAETAGKFGIAVKLLDIPCKFLRKKIVSGYVHLIPGSKQDMIYATFAAVVEFECNFVANAVACNTLHPVVIFTAASRSGSHRAPAGRTARVRILSRNFSGTWDTSLGYATRRLIPSGPTSCGE